MDAAKDQAKVRPPQHPTNGDELRYPAKLAGFSKGLPHNNNGEVDLAAYEALVKACSTGNPDDFEKIPLSGTRKVVNPQSGFAFTLIGADPWSLATPPAYTFDSEDQAGEAAEVYWMALTRDIPFSQYGEEPVTRAAIADLNRFARFRGADAGSLFGVHSPASPGMPTGPYISQFLTLDVPFGPTTVAQQYPVDVPGVHYIHKAKLDQHIRRLRPPQPGRQGGEPRAARGLPEVAAAPPPPP